jgi:hypothetical protein
LTGQPKIGKLQREVTRQGNQAPTMFSSPGMSLTANGYRACAFNPKMYLTTVTLICTLFIILLNTHVQPKNFSCLPAFLLTVKIPQSPK